MVIYRHLLVLELYLYVRVLIQPLICSKIDGDYTVYDEVTSFDATLRIVDEIRDKPCLPCFKNTYNWKGLHSFTQFSTSVNTDIVTSTEILTTVSKEIRFETSSSDNEMTDHSDAGNENYTDDHDGDNRNNGDDDDDKEATETENEENLDQIKVACILLITHVIAAGIGAGILYFIQFIKEYRRKRADGTKLESNDEMINALYENTRGTDILQTSNVSQQEEGIYSEVADKPESLQYDYTILNYSTGNALNDTKHSQLPDIPHDYERDEQYLLPKISKNLFLPDTHAHKWEKVKTSTSIVQEVLLKDGNELNQGTERYEILQDTSTNGGGHNVYSVLQKDYLNLTS